VDKDYGHRENGIKPRASLSLASKLDSIAIGDGTTS
jgi:hypothetical protein